MSFKDSGRLVDKWRLVFVKNKAREYQFDGSLSGSLLMNTTAMETAESYVSALIYNDDPYWLQSLTLPKNRQRFNNKKLLKEVNKYKLYDKKPEGFTIKRVEEGDNQTQFNIQFQAAKGSTHSMNLSVTEGIDGYYVV